MVFPLADQLFEILGEGADIPVGETRELLNDGRQGFAHIPQVLESERGAVCLALLWGHRDAFRASLEYAAGQSNSAPLKGAKAL